MEIHGKNKLSVRFHVFQLVYLSVPKVKKKSEIYITKLAKLIRTVQLPCSQDIPESRCEMLKVTHFLQNCGLRNNL